MAARSIMRRRTVLVTAALLLASAADGRAAEPDVYRQTLRATAWVITPTRAKGTGWVLDRGRNVVVTNYHVVGDNETVNVLFPVFRDGKLVADRAFYLDNLNALKQVGRVVKRDPSRDLALLALESLPEGTGELTLAG